MQPEPSWDIGRLIDLGSDLYSGMPCPPYPDTGYEMRELDLIEYSRIRKREYQSYSQEVRMCVQASTYLETGAHLFPEMEKVDQIGLDRLFLSAVVLQVSVGPREKVHVEHLQTALAESGETIRPGDAVLVATGYNYAEDPQMERTPHFSYDSIEWVVGQKPAILGSDMANWQDPEEKPSFFGMLLSSGTLLLAHMLPLNGIAAPRIQLIVLPIKIRGAWRRAG